MENTQEPNWLPMIGQFLVTLSARNLSQNTIRAYRRDLIELGEFVGPDANASQIDRIRIRAFLVQLREAGICPKSVYRKLQAIKTFYRWMDDEESPYDARILTLSCPRGRDQIPDVPSEAAMMRLCDGAVVTAFPERDRVIPELLYGSGIRVSELVGINLSDFKYKDALLIRGKGRKERMVPVTECAQSAIEAWLRVRETFLLKFDVKTPALLFSLGPRHSAQRLDVRSIRRILTAMARAKSLPDYHPHQLRHACGTHLHDNDVHLLAISRLLGHSRLATTQIYTRVSTGRMMRVYRTAHPHN
jgi:integrase/recombinase XerC